MPNIVFSQNSVGSAVPPFGGFDPNTQATLGFGVLGDDGGFTVGLFAGKGNQRTSVTQSPMVVVPNGGVGSVFSGQLRPFVTGVTPVLGNGFGGNGFGPMLMNPPQPDGQAFRSDRITEQRSKSGPSSFSDPNSTAMRGDLSVEAIERQRQAALAQQSQEFLADIKKLVKDADKMVEREKYGAARAKYARAIRKLAKFPQFSELRESISKKLSEIQSRR